MSGLLSVFIVAVAGVFALAGLIKLIRPVAAAHALASLVQPGGSSSHGHDPRLLHAARAIGIAELGVAAALLVDTSVATAGVALAASASFVVLSVRSYRTKSSCGCFSDGRTTLGGVARAASLASLSAIGVVATAAGTSTGHSAGSVVAGLVAAAVVVLIGDPALVLVPLGLAGRRRKQQAIQTVVRLRHDLDTRLAPSGERSHLSRRGFIAGTAALSVLASAERVLRSDDAASAASTDDAMLLPRASRRNLLAQFATEANASLLLPVLAGKGYVPDMTMAKAVMSRTPHGWTNALEIPLLHADAKGTPRVDLPRDGRLRYFPAFPKTDGTSHPSVVALLRPERRLLRAMRGKVVDWSLDDSPFVAPVNAARAAALRAGSFSPQQLATLDGGAH